MSENLKRSKYKPKQDDLDIDNISNRTNSMLLAITEDLRECKGTLLSIQLSDGTDDDKEGPFLKEEWLKRKYKLDKLLLCIFFRIFLYYPLLSLFKLLQ